MSLQDLLGKSDSESAWSHIDEFLILHGPDAVALLIDMASALEAIKYRPIEPRFYCKGGRDTCEDCVGSCGIEEYESVPELLARFKVLNEKAGT